MNEKTHIQKLLTGYFIPIISIVLCILLRIASSTQFFDSFLKRFIEEKNMNSSKQIIDLVDYCIFVIPIAFQSIIRARKAARYKEAISKIGQNQRELVSHMLSEKGYIVGTCDDINIRVFKKRFSRLVLDDRINLCSREINGPLSFSIKNNEGLCSIAYNERSSVLETEDGAKEEYHLTYRQKVLAGNLKFIVAVPICMSNESVKRIICFDSFQQISNKGSEEGILKICEQVAYYLDTIID